MEAVPVNERESRTAFLVAEALRKHQRRQALAAPITLSPMALGALQSICWEQMARTDVSWSDLEPHLRVTVEAALALYAGGRAEADIEVGHLLDRLAQRESCDVYIARVKAWREATGAGLKEAKDRVTVLYGRGGPEPQPGTARPKVRLYVELDEEALRVPFEKASGEDFGLASRLLYDANEIDAVRSSGGRRVLKSRTRTVTS